MTNKGKELEKIFRPRKTKTLKLNRETFWTDKNKTEERNVESNASRVSSPSLELYNEAIKNSVQKYIGKLAQSTTFYQVKKLVLIFAVDVDTGIKSNGEVVTYISVGLLHGSKIHRWECNTFAIFEQTFKIVNSPDQVWEQEENLWTP